MARAIIVGGRPTDLATAILLAKRGVEIVALDSEASAPGEVDATTSFCARGFR
jgi:glycine/D-amino acid oxidase-like deaminating enzyme